MRSGFRRIFMFQLTREEVKDLILQPAISSWGGQRQLPYAFTEHGVAMLSAVLRSRRAVEMSILVVRVFVKLREMVASNRDLGARTEKLEASQQEHASVINILAEEIDMLKIPLPPPSKRIGFQTS